MPALSSQQSSPQLLQISDLSVTIDEKSILKNINLSIRFGDKILLKGESGSGKSTLLKAMIFFQQFRGNILFEGHSIGLENIRDFRLQCGYIGQVLPGSPETVDDFLAMPFRYTANKHKAFPHKEVDRLLQRLNFQPEVKTKNYRQLSGGEKQRMVILQLLLMKRPILLLDEVTSALDKKNIRAVVSLLTEQPEQTVIAVSHNHEWESYCTRIVEMEQGQIISQSNSQPADNSFTPGSLEEPGRGE